MPNIPVTALIASIRGFKISRVTKFTALAKIFLMLSQILLNTPSTPLNAEVIAFAISDHTEEAVLETAFQAPLNHFHTLSHAVLIPDHKVSHTPDMMAEMVFQALVA